MTERIPGDSVQDWERGFRPTEAIPIDALFGLPSSRPAPEPLAQEPPPQEQAGTISTFLYARVHQFTAACQTMAGNELTAFVNDVRRALSAALVKLKGEIAQRRPDSIL